MDNPVLIAAGILLLLLGGFGIVKALDDGGGGGGDNGSCKMAASGLELIGEGLSHGHLKESIESLGGLDQACEAAVETWQTNSTKPVSITIEGENGDTLDRDVTGTELSTPAASGGGSPPTGLARCFAYRVQLLFDICINQELRLPAS